VRAGPLVVGGGWGDWSRRGVDPRQYIRRTPRGHKRCDPAQIRMQFRVDCIAQYKLASKLPATVAACGMDPIGHTLGRLLMSYIATPKDAVRFASVNKSMRRLEGDVVYVAVRVSAADTEAVAWLLMRAARIPSVRIACTNAPGPVLLAAHTLARALPTGACQLELDSKLFKCLLRLLDRDGARLVTLLKRHSSD